MSFNPLRRAHCFLLYLELLYLWNLKFKYPAFWSQSPILLVFFFKYFSSTLLSPPDSCISYLTSSCLSFLLHAAWTSWCIIWSTLLPVSSVLNSCVFLLHNSGCWVLLVNNYTNVQIDAIANWCQTHQMSILFFFFFYSSAPSFIVRRYNFKPSSLSSGSLHHHLCFRFQQMISCYSTYKLNCGTTSYFLYPSCPKGKCRKVPLLGSKANPICADVPSPEALIYQSSPLLYQPSNSISSILS